MSLNRRDFLKAIGISAAVACFHPLPALAACTADSAPAPELLARWLRNHADQLTDSVAPIWAVYPDSYLTALGRIEKQHVQPILAQDYRPPASIQPDPHISTGAVVQVAAPSARLYAQPRIGGIIGVVGHGGIGQVIDILPPGNPRDVTWIAVISDNAQRPVWSQAHLWSPLVAGQPAADERSLVIDTVRRRLTAYERDEAVFSAPFASAGDLSPGRTSVSDRAMTRTGFIPYALSLGDPAHGWIGGAWHHNQFGGAVTDGAPVQLPIYTARALYEFLPVGAAVHIL
ncbi:MAG: L,D-transpeptidase [bacterium]|nr:L,D-transpeptidase [bacterium]